MYGGKTEFEAELRPFPSQAGNITNASHLQDERERLERRKVGNTSHACLPRLMSHWSRLHMCYIDQYSRWPYAPSWFPNRQHTRNTNRRYHLLTCATVQSVSAPASLLSFSVLETSLTTIWLVFQLKHLPCPSMFWFKREGRSSTTAAHFLVSDSVGVCFPISSVRGLNTQERPACPADT